MGLTQGKKDTVTTALGTKQSLTIFFIAILLIIGLFFLFKTYSELSGETIVIENEEDVLEAETTINVKLDQLEKDKEALKALIS